MFLWLLPGKIVLVKPGAERGCLCLSGEVSKLSCAAAAECRADKGRAHRASSWLLCADYWVGQAEEAVLVRVCTPPRWCFETLSASFLQAHLCVGIASRLRNVFPLGYISESGLIVIDMCVERRHWSRIALFLLFEGLGMHRN